MNIGAMRSFSDIAALGTRESAVTVAMMHGHSWTVRVPTILEWISFHNRYLPEIKFALEIVPGTRRALKRSGVAGAFARASCGHIPYETLSNFARILVSGMPEGGPADVTVIRLRDRLSAAKASSGWVAQRETYDATAYALVAFHEGRALSRIFCAPTELFPLPVR